MSLRKRDPIKTPKNASRPVDDPGVQGVTDGDIAKALASLPTYRFCGSVGPYKTDDSMSSFERWCLQKGRDEDDESNRIYDQSKDAFSFLCRRHGVERAYSIVDTVRSFVDVANRSSSYMEDVLSDTLHYIEYWDNQ